MPVGIQRLNAKKSQPNSQIIFIKPLPGPDENIAQDYLQRIAAQCWPIMRDNHLSVMTLEEFEPNREFVGRNFNAGEVIQLVLKSPGSGRWLPFTYVQMVMMHELAHCNQMNHSRAFWAVRNQYASQMYGLWSKGYTGEGIWGRGTHLLTGEREKNTVRAGEALPEHLCGGTYRSRRKRKKKKSASYQERKQRRVEKKFGKGGVTLGADEDARVKLEKGKKITAKPRVASSARARELRAAAAMSRFEKQKAEKKEARDEDEGKFALKRETGADSGSEVEDDAEEALEYDGSRIKDEHGLGMIKVCEDEDKDDPQAKGELKELQEMFQKGIKQESPEPVELGDIEVVETNASSLDDTRTVEKPIHGLKNLPVDRSPGINIDFGMIVDDVHLEEEFKTQNYDPRSSESAKKPPFVLRNFT